MNWSYTFAKDITLTDYYKQYLHQSSYTKSVSTKKAYIVDTSTTFFARNSTSGVTTSTSYNYTSSSATRYRYGSKYTLTKPQLSTSANTYTKCTIKVYNPNDTSVNYWDDNIGYTTISAYGSYTYSYSWKNDQYTSESKTFKGYFTATNCYSSSTSSLSVDKPYDAKPTLTKPSITINYNTNYSFSVTYTNNASVTATLYTYNGNVSLTSGSSKTYTNIWSTSSVSLYAYASASGYTTSDTVRTTLTRPSLITPTAPSLDIMSNTYDNWIATIYNPNDVEFDVYDNGGTLIVSKLSPKSSQQYGDSWSGTSHTLKCYFMGDGTTYSDSAMSSLTITRPDAPKPSTMNSPAITYAKGTGNYKTKWKITVTNTNSFNVSATISGDDITTYTVNINANSFTYFYVDILAIEERTYKAIFSKDGYSDTSSTLTIPIS